MHAVVPGPDVSIDDPARQEAIASLRRKRKLVEDAWAFVAVNGVLWIVWALADRSRDGLLPWPAWVTLIWGFLLLVDAARAYGPWPRRHPIDDAEIEREAHRLGLR